MSNTKNTQEPWLPKCYKGKKFSLDGWYVQSGDETIAIIYGNTPEEVESNAKIMAAARDLLEICQLINASEPLPKHLSDELQFAIQKATQ